MQSLANYVIDTQELFQYPPLVAVPFMMYLYENRVNTTVAARVYILISKYVKSNSN